MLAKFDRWIRRSGKRVLLARLGLQTCQPNLQTILFDPQVCARAAQVCYLECRFRVSCCCRSKAAGNGERVANGYSWLERVRSGVSDCSADEERPVLADLHLHERLQDQVLLLKRALDLMGQVSRCEAARL